MAGAGYKLFATGDVLTAAQVNTYLMQQTVMVFASSAARTTALSGVLAEGMVSYLQDTNSLEVYDGAAWIGATGDLTALTAGTGISITNPTGPVPTVAIDTAVTADLTTAQTLTNKTLTSPVLTTPSISNIQAKGDILVGTADNTLGVITAGSNGETLVADSSAATGLSWQGNYAAGKNVVINGGFDVWQRGTSFTGVASGTYTTDRWKTTLTATGLSCNVTQDTSVPNSKSKYSIKVLQATSATSVGEYEVRTAFETSQILPLCGSTTTLSFWYRSNLTGAHAARLYASPMTGGTDVSISFTVSAANTWEKKVLNFSSFAGVTTASTAPTAEAAGLSIGFNVFGSASRSTLAANDFFQVAQVQLEVGSVNTSFTRASGNISTELAACQRYYVSWNRDAAVSDGGICIGFASSTTSARFYIPLPVVMRVTPTVLDFSTLGTNRIVGAEAVTALVFTSAVNNRNTAAVTATATGLTATQPVFLNVTTSGYIGIGAEL
jgi:hypothetical protein